MALFRNLLIVAATLMVCCSPTIGNATVFNFYWTGNPALDSSIVSSYDPTLQATGTIEINANPGSTFTLADIVSTNITVTGANISNFNFTSWSSAGGTIAADGLSATFNAADTPYYESSDMLAYFGCDFIGCYDSNPVEYPLGIYDTNYPNNTYGEVNYSTLQDELASMHMTASSVPATPLPASVPLFSTGLGVLGLLGWRRKRKEATFAA